MQNFNLSSLAKLSSKDGKKIDLVVTLYNLSPPSTAIDVTISIPLLSSHVNAAAVSASTLFTDRAAEKDAKHLPGCIELGRGFLPIVLSSFGGIGPISAREWIDSLYHPSAATERRGGGTGSRTAHRRQLLLQSIQATLARSLADTIDRLSSAPRPGDEIPPRARR